MKFNKLTTDQQQALAFLKDFYTSDKQIATLSGYAGTGKTYLLNYFVNNIVKHSCCITAPTHKAVRIAEKAINKKGKTLHSLHGLRPNTDLSTFNIDNVQFDTLGEPHIKNYKLVIIDECSQINQHLQTLNESRAKSYGVKILYVGDEAQLPPVKEDISKTFLIQNKYCMKEIVRQDNDNPLLELLTVLRDDIIDGTQKYLKFLSSNRNSINSKGEGFIVSTNETFTKDTNTLFTNKEFGTKLDYCRLISYTNANIKVWNNYIRKNIIHHNDIICKEDLLTGYKTIVDEYLSPIVINSDDYTVSDIETRVSEHGFKMYYVQLTNLLTNVPTHCLIVDHIDKSFKNYYDILNKLHFQAIYTRDVSMRRKCWKEYFEFKNRYLCLIDFELKNTDGTSRGFVTKDLDYGYGITSHKSQGSTYENVLVNLNNMIKYNNKVVTYPKDKVIFRTKLFYVAASRASKKVHILI